MLVEVGASEAFSEYRIPPIMSRIVDLLERCRFDTQDSGASSNALVLRSSIHMC